MGYSTEYVGTIRIRNLNLERVRILNQYLGKDKRDLDPSLGVPGVELPFNHFDLELTEELHGLRWNGSEKTYGMREALNFLREVATLEFQGGDFMICQGEELEDRYMLIVINNEIQKHSAAPAGVLECPECSHRFLPGAETT